MIRYLNWKLAFVAVVTFALGVAFSPERMTKLELSVDTAEAGFGGGRGGGRGGMRGGGGRHFGGGHRGGGGFKARPHRPAGGSKIRPRPRPKPGIAARPARPNKPAVAARPNRPRPGNRPNAGTRPNRPVAGGRPAVRPVRPGRPGVRPPGYRPPHYRPPHWRPPAWRPPYYRPPYPRPPHWAWGPYYYNPAWGWYFTAALVGSTLVFIESLPDDKECEEVQYEDETLYECDGILYRSTVYEEKRVYEVVSSDEEAEEAVASGGASSSAAPATADAEGPLFLTSPMMRGNSVKAVQIALSSLGYDVGTPDGVFGSGTDQAVRAFQRDQGLPENGIVAGDTQRALGL